MMLMRKYRHKPTEIEAIQWDGTRDMLRALRNAGCNCWGDTSTNPMTLNIQTLHGSVAARAAAFREDGDGDWIMRGPQRDWWVCAHDNFVEMYGAA